MGLIVSSTQGVEHLVQRSRARLVFRFRAHPTQSAIIVRRARHKWKATHT